MEMPEGWNRIKECTKLGYILLESDRIEITDLMKEMAEALELVTCHCSLKEIFSGHKSECQQPRINEILEKFKEWK